MTRARGELLRFAIAGVAGLLVDIGVLSLALQCGLGFYGGRLLSFLAAVFCTWRINRRYTFARRAGALPPSSWNEWWRYLGAMLGGGAVNYAVYSAIVYALPQLPLLGPFAVACGGVAGLAINFLSAKFFVFHH